MSDITEFAEWEAKNRPLIEEEASQDAQRRREMNMECEGEGAFESSGDESAAGRGRREGLERRKDEGRSMAPPPRPAPRQPLQERPTQGKGQQERKSRSRSARRRERTPPVPEWFAREVAKQQEKFRINPATGTVDDTDECETPDWRVKRREEEERRRREESMSELELDGEEEEKHWSEEDETLVAEEIENLRVVEETETDEDELQDQHTESQPPAEDDGAMADGEEAEDLQLEEDISMVEDKDSEKSDLDSEEDIANSEEQETMNLQSMQSTAEAEEEEREAEALSIELQAQAMADAVEDRVQAELDLKNIGNNVLKLAEFLFAHIDVPLEDQEGFLVTLLAASKDDVIELMDVIFESRVHEFQVGIGEYLLTDFFLPALGLEEQDVTEFRTEVKEARREDVVGLYITQLRGMRASIVSQSKESWNDDGPRQPTAEWKSDKAEKKRSKAEKKARRAARKQANITEHANSPADTELPPESSIASQVVEEDHMAASLVTKKRKRGETCAEAPHDAPQPLSTSGNKKHKKAVTKDESLLNHPTTQMKESHLPIPVVGLKENAPLIALPNHLNPASDTSRRSSFDLFAHDISGPKPFGWSLNQWKKYKRRVRDERNGVPEELAEVAMSIDDMSSKPADMSNTKWKKIQRLHRESLLSAQISPKPDMQHCPTVIAVEVAQPSPIISSAPADLVRKRAFAMSIDSVESTETPQDLEPTKKRARTRKRNNNALPASQMPALETRVAELPEQDITVSSDRKASRYQEPRPELTPLVTTKSNENIVDDSKGFASMPISDPVSGKKKKRSSKERQRLKELTSGNSRKQKKQKRLKDSHDRSLKAPRS